MGGAAATGHHGVVTAERSDWVRDVSPGDWIAGRLHPFNQDTGSIIPEGFDAYCRVFHPIAPDGRWEALAQRNGRIVHSQMQLHAIAVPRGERIPPFTGEMYSSASWGSLQVEARQALAETLRPHTTTPDRCWFAAWEGWGALDDHGVVERVQLPGRGYLLASGPIDAATGSVVEPPFDRSPSLWWPDDRAWFVATEIDYAWTYVGGTRAAIGAVLADDRLEALPVLLSDLPFYDADTVNAALDG